MIRGAIFRVNLEDVTPPEFGKTRPAIILSNSEQNLVLTTVVVVPLSTRPPEVWPLRLKLPQLPGLQPSFAVVTGLRQVSKQRLLEEIGRVPEAFMRELSEACAAYLGE